MYYRHGGRPGSFYRSITIYEPLRRESYPFKALIDAHVRVEVWSQDGYVLSPFQGEGSTNPIQFRARLCGVFSLKFWLELSTEDMDKALENIQINEYNNRKIVISTKQGTPLRVQLPRMYMPFGVSGFTPEVGPTKYNVDFAIKGYDEEESYMKKFYETLRQLEGAIIDAVVEQSETIFGSQMTKEDLLPMFNSNVKESPGREPKFRIKVDTTMEDQIKANVFDADKNPIRDEATNGLYARNSGHAIVELNSVYFLNRKFGCTWKLHQLIVYEPQNLKGFQFII